MKTVDVSRTGLGVVDHLCEGLDGLNHINMRLRLMAAYRQVLMMPGVCLTARGSWSLDSEGSGFEKMESGINARPIDFARFGRLSLNGGMWEGVEIIPTQWVTESTQQDESIDRLAYYSAGSFFNTMGGYYAYMWWGRPRDDGDYDFAAWGKYGQFVYISPHKKLIIVRHGARDGGFDWMRLFYDVASKI